MSDLPPAERLAKLHTLEEWLAWQLESTRRKIRDLEQQQKRQAQQYVVEPPIHIHHPEGATVHRAGCTTIRRSVRHMSARDARIALEKDPRMFHACEDCAPGRSLGLTAG
ncbi:hypothetical protein SAMN04490357_0184 [Streptomyces misionensis]|uniref:Uncharacterized protein n=1 Tax=Streptomyces misionensis TaxID=67331 RepID=A0A1H4IC21_9ACTN|nr:DUF6233 domain-containing protein [Streptomyces misionensis]SEB31617.1 hypothetical protein SAMN04490357_0184 [Streptomyces misionensis]